MAANEIRTHARPGDQPETFSEIEVAAILKRRTALDYSTIAALC